MKALAKHWAHDAIGVCTGIAGLALLIAIVSTGDAIGLGVGALIGGSCAFGVLACGLKQTVARRSHRRSAEASEAPLPSHAPPPAIFPSPHFVGATASDFDAARQPGFARVTSLTEAQVLRQRAMRDREKRRARLTGVSPTADAAS